MARMSMGMTLCKLCFLSFSIFGGKFLFGDGLGERYPTKAMYVPTKFNERYPRCTKFRTSLWPVVLFRDIHGFVSCFCRWI